MRKMHCIARDHSRRIFQENEMLKSELENQRKELEWRCKELDKRHAQNGFDERKLIDEKRKVIILPCQNLVCIWNCIEGDSIHALWSLISSVSGVHIPYFSIKRRKTKKIAKWQACIDRIQWGCVLCSERIMLFVDFHSRQRERSCTFLPFAYEIKILSIKENQFIFLLSPKENVLYQMIKQ